MKKIVFVAVLLIAFVPVFSQCPNAQFSVVAPACAGQPVQVANNSTNAVTYSWDFCAGDFAFTPEGADDPSTPAGPTSMNVVFDGTNWYGFVASYSTNHIFRFDFGNSLGNIPSGPVDLGNPGNMITGVFFNEISFRFENGNWHAVFVVTNGFKIFSLDFGASLTNPNPVPSSYTHALLTDGLSNQDMQWDHDSLFVFVGNNTYSQIHVFKYGNSILNTPVIDTIVPAGYITEDIKLVKTCNAWIGYAVSYTSSVLLKLDFGSSLNNKPVVTSLGNAGGLIFHPNGLVLANDGIEWVAFVNNYNGGLIKVRLGADISNPVLNASPLTIAGISGVGSSVNIAKDGSAFYIFPTSFQANKFGKIKYEAPCSASPATSNAAVPSGISYATSDTFLISLTAFDSLNNRSFFLDSVTTSISPVSNFVTSNHCYGDSVLFVDSSTIAGGTIISRKWHFGDGDSASVLNPYHSYASTGDYDVRLVTVASTGCPDTLQKTIHIASKPVAGFLSVTGCSDQSLSFSDSSVIAAGTIVDWQWDFGDGTGSSSNQDPFYTYTDGGTYPVSLTVTSDSGCTDIHSKPISVNSTPDGSFQVSNTCVGQVVQFTNQTVSDTTILSYYWDFGDLTNDTVQNPSHSYLAAVASYPVSLIAYSANGCNDTVNQSIKINNIPTVDFSYSPANACEGNFISFTDLSTVAGDTVSKWLWNFGDGFTDTVANPVHTFDAFGPYSVSLIAYAATNCGNSSTQNISVIESPTAQFSYTAVCLGITTAFTDLTSIPSGSSITRYHWDFGDGDTSDLQNPTHDFLTPGIHTVVLTVETNFGCTDQDTLAVTVHPPPNASFSYSNPCSHYPIDFASTSSVPVPYTINSYRWSFGDPASGTNDTSSLATPSHSYDTTASYAITLIVTSNAGCADTTFQVLSIKQSSIVNFQYSPTCLGDYTDFANLTTPPSLDTAWFWKFGDGQFSLLREPAHYYVNPGPYQVTLTATSSNGCVSEATKTVMVSPIPVADFLNTPICIGTPHQFQDNSSIAQGSSLASWHWVVSGLDSSNVQNPVFNFPDTGTYIVTLKVTSSDSCKKSVSKTVRVYPLPVANFVFNPQYGNPPLAVNFTNLTTGGSTYQWSFGDGGLSTAVNPSNIYQDTGKFLIRLVSLSMEGCLDTVEKSIYVIKPLLDLALRNISSYVQDHHLYLSAEVINLGTRDVNTFNISADVDNGNSIRETYTGFLPNGPQGIRLYNFNASFEITEGMDIRYFCIRVSEPNGEQDNVPSNDEKCSSLESTFSLKAPYPNPFTSGLTIEIILPYSDLLTIEIFDQAGKKVRELYNGTAGKGLTTVQADLQGLAAGVYALKCTFRDEVIVRPIMKSNIPK